MPTLVVDACGGLHLKQLGALPLLDMLRERGAKLASANAVYGELVTMSLSEWLDRSGVERAPVKLAERKAVRNACDPRRLPGSNDCDSIALARRERAVLFTHDDPCAHGARALRLTVVDACDLADFHVARGWSDWDQMEALLQRLDGFAYRPVDWSGSVRGTVEPRAYRARLLQRLALWWASEDAT